MALVIVLGVVGWFVLRARSRRADRRAGLSSAAPTFTVEPPRRHLSTLKGERL